MDEHEAAAVDDTVVSDSSLYGGIDDGLPMPEIGMQPPQERAIPARPLDRGAGEPRRLGRYIVFGTLGQGGMGKVLRAHDETLGRDVALKVLHDVGGDRHEQRLLREAQALARLSHPNVVSVYDVGESDGRLYIAMELVEGVALDRWQHEPRPWPEVLEVYRQAGRGLAAAHAEGLVHRDFKPANCILDDRGRVKVLDFGLARGVATVTGSHAAVTEAGDTHDHRLLAAEERSSRASQRALERPLTRTGTRLGTLAYMSPEQLMGLPADPRSDQFAFCVSFYEALYGRRPFVGKSVWETLLRIQAESLHVPTAPAGLPPVPKWLVALLRRGLATASHERHPDMNALLVALERGMARRRALRGAALGVVLLAGLGGALVGSGAWRSERPCEGLREQPMPAWADEDRREVGEALAASGLPEAERVSERVVGRLDAYARAWTDARAEACEATLVRHELGEQALVRRRACLDDRAMYVRVAVAELSEGDARVAARASDVVDGLPELAACDDVEALLSGPEPVPEALAGEAEEIRWSIARSWVLDATGNEERGVGTADRAVEQAKALDGAPVLELEALLNRGSLLRLARRWPEARRDLEAALELAERIEDSARALDVLTQLVLLGAAEQDVSAANGALVAVRGKLTRLEAQPRRAAQRWWLEGVVASQAGRAEAALAAADRAVALYERLAVPVEEEHVEALMLQGSALEQLGELDRAYEASARALVLAEEGARTPLVIKALFRLGWLRQRQGQLDSARAMLERELALRDAFYGPRDSASIRTRTSLARVLQLQGELTQALQQLSLAQQSFDEQVPPSIRREVLELRGALLRARGQWEAAIASYSEARQALRSSPSPDRVRLAMLDSNIADCLSAKGDLPSAQSTYDAVLAVLAVDTPADDPRRAYPLLGRGKLLLALGEREAGIRDLRAALGLARALAQDPSLAADLRWALGRALRPDASASPEATREAAALVRQARDACAEVGLTELTQEMDAWLADCGPMCTSPEDPTRTTTNDHERANDEARAP